MMRFIAVAVFACIGFTAQGQDFKILPKAALEYVTSPGGRNISPMSFKNDTIPDAFLGRWTTKLGVDFLWRDKLKLSFDTEIYMGSDFAGIKRWSFVPVQGNYSIRFHYQPLSRLPARVYVEHVCFHPFRVSDRFEQRFRGYWGGHTVIGVSYNY